MVIACGLENVWAKRQVLLFSFLYHRAVQGLGWMPESSVSEQSIFALGELWPSWRRRLLQGWDKAKTNGQRPRPARWLCAGSQCTQILPEGKCHVFQRQLKKRSSLDYPNRDLLAGTSVDHPKLSLKAKIWGFNELSWNQCLISSCFLLVF